MIKLLALLSSVFINLYGAVFLLATATKKLKNRFFLGLFFLNSFILFTGHFLSFYEYWHIFKHYDFLFLASLLAFYPFYFLYIYSAFNFEIISTKWLYHFIPAILIAATMFFVSYFSSTESYEIYMNNNLYSTPLTTPISKILAYLYKGARGFHLIQILVYNILIIRFILKSLQNLSNFFSSIDNYQLRNFYLVTISFILLMSIPGFYVTVIGRTPLNTNDYLLLFVCILFTTLYAILAIIGLKQTPTEISLYNEFNALTSTTLNTHEIDEIKEKLNAYFRTEKPWLNPHLNIWEIAKQIGTNRTYVSKIINEDFGVNFNQFVNSFRVNEAKLLLKKDNNLSLTEISEKSGFGSVNSFSRIFKTFENCTPFEFKKK